MSASVSEFGLTGHVIDAPSFGEVRSIPDGAVVVSDGKIVAVGEAAILNKDPRFTSVDWHTFPEETRPVILPGLIDVHAHIPQYPSVARRESELLPWLNRYVFPAEQAFRGGGVREYLEAFFKDLGHHGTTTAMLYGAVWEDSTDLAFRIAEKTGNRAIIGKVMMDVGSYGDLGPEDGPEQSLAETERLCEKWHGAADGLLDYAVSPRFAVTCTMNLMKGAAAIAEKHECYIQTHLSENQAEIDRVAELFPETGDYTQVYRDAGLLGPKTVLGHCLHLSGREVRELAEANACIAHCPTSNLFLNSGLIPLKRLRGAGLRIGLGSDVAGGPELNLWQVMRSAIEVQKARRFLDDDVPELTPAEAFFLATAGGAEVLGKESAIGQLETGYEADISVFDLRGVLPLRGAFEKADMDLTGEEVLTLLVYRGQPDACLATFVRGRPTYKTSA
ncbi:MAG: guanine deaminase [Verrucomicrobiota bacterium]